MLAIDTPAFKAGGSYCVSIYRRISLTVLNSNLLEHVLHSFIMVHLEACSTLMERHNGLRMGRFRKCQIIIAANGITHNLCHDLQNDLKSFDFSKAFDKVSHHHLLYKLQFLWHR